MQLHQLKTLSSFENTSHLLRKQILFALLTVQVTKQTPDQSENISIPLTTINFLVTYVNLQAVYYYICMILIIDLKSLYHIEWLTDTAPSFTFINTNPFTYVISNNIYIL